LRDARLVRVREQGREWHYTLDPDPLAQVYEHWLGSFAPLWDQSLTRLKRTLSARRRTLPGDRCSFRTGSSYEPRRPMPRGVRSHRRPPCHAVDLSRFAPRQTA
jgi:hypothetical protein